MSVWIRTIYIYIYIYTHIYIYIYTHIYIYIYACMLNMISLHVFSGVRGDQRRYSLSKEGCKNAQTSCIDMSSSTYSYVHACIIQFWRFVLVPEYTWIAHRSRRRIYTYIYIYICINLSLHIYICGWLYYCLTVDFVISCSFCMLLLDLSTSYSSPAIFEECTLGS